MDKLKPCPFCGAIPTQYKLENNGESNWYYVICVNEKCRIKPHTDYHICKAVTTREWNRRVNDEQTDN